MSTNKTNKIIIISLISVITIIALMIIFLITYMTTDILKSEKELFFKYAMQLGEKEENSNINEYFEKKKQQPYKNDGSITVNIETSEESIKEEIESANKVNITFNGNIDNIEKIAQEEISINYDENVKFPISFRCIGDTYGLQTEYVGAKYIAIENNELKKLFTKMGMVDVSNIPDKIDTEKKEQIKLTEEEKQILSQRYKEVLSEQLPKEQFTKLQNNESIIYTLELTPEQIKNILKKLIETVKTDDIIISKLNEITEKEINPEDFDELIEEIDEIEIEESIKIKVYQTNKKLSQIVIEKGTQEQIAIEKIQNQNDLQYILKYSKQEDENQIEANVKIQYSGLSNLDNVKELYNIEIAITEQETTSYEYNFENNITFSSNTQIEEFDENNAIILNNQDSETIEYLMEAIGQRITEVNEAQMEELGAEINPLIYTNPITLYTIMMFNSIEQNVSQNQNDFFATMENDNENLNEYEKFAFNATLEKYEGKQEGSAINSLIQEVNLNNMSEDTRNIELVGETENIVASSNYNVTIKYDNEGYINEIIIQLEQ